MAGIDALSGEQLVVHPHGDAVRLPTSDALGHLITAPRLDPDQAREYAREIEAAADAVQCREAA